MMAAGLPDSVGTHSGQKASNTQRQLGSWNLRTMMARLEISGEGTVSVQGGGLGKLTNLAF